MPRGLLFVRIDVPAEVEADFQTWYNEEHIPWRLKRVPGFLSARRYRALEGSPKYAAVYDVASPAVLESREYVALRDEERDRPTEIAQRVVPRFSRLERSIYEEITPDPADYTPPAEGKILLVAMLVPRPDREEEFNAWYDTEHLPALKSIPGFLSARRFRALEGEPRYLALYDVADYSVFGGEAYKTKRESPWADRIRSQLASRVRNVYERIL
ncbi:MAG: hypothetical protein HY329_04950 [Chloroflexi bacterium]|nr:hypothetical protein [Chloroflexota bacterium]